MSKKIMLLALAAVSAILLALPAMASATEIHLEGGAGVAFAGEDGAGSLKAPGEPTITGQKTDLSGEFTTDTTGDPDDGLDRSKHDHPWG